MKAIPVRTVFVAPPSTAADFARVTMPAAPWEQAERIMMVDDPRPPPPPKPGPKGKPKGAYNR